MRREPTEPGRAGPRRAKPAARAGNTAMPAGVDRGRRELGSPRADTARLGGPEVSP